MPGGAHLAGAPVRGSLLVAHPCLAGNIFARSVVLVCRHDATGSYGLVLNKPLGSSLQHLHERLRQLQGGGGAAGATAGAGAGGAGGRLLGGGQGGAWEAAGGAGTASELEAASGDIPAEQLQQVVDYLAWKGSLQAAAAAAPEYDEYGNWIEQVRGALLFVAAGLASPFHPMACVSSMTGRCLSPGSQGFPPPTLPPSLPAALHRGR